MSEFRHVIVLLPLLAGGCVHGPVETSPAEPALGRAAALVDEGCYPCLLEALDVYEQRVTFPGARQRQAAATHGVKAALLLAIRQKELGLDGTEALRRADRLRSLAESPHDRTPSASRRRADALFAAVRVVPSDRTGWMSSNASRSKPPDRSQSNESPTPQPALTQARQMPTTPWRRT